MLNEIELVDFFTQENVESLKQIDLTTNSKPKFTFNLYFNLTKAIRTTNFARSFGQQTGFSTARRTIDNTGSISIDITNKILELKQ